MTTIALILNVYKSQSKSIAIGIREFLNNLDCLVVAEDEEAEGIGAPPLSSVDLDTVDYTITLGGDGTILRLIHQYPELNSPILGINLGSLGFLADIPITDIYPSLEDLLAGHYTVQERMMMDGATVTNEKCFAVNEIAIHRARNACLVSLVLHVDGIYLNTFTADGIIIATSSGSTAYSLAAGGPILTPNLQAFVITPISPHTISNRPIVLMPEKEIQVQYISEHQPVEIAFDGYSHNTMTTGEVFHVSPSEKKFRLINLHHHDYFSTLRKKLGWTGKLKM